MSRVLVGCPTFSNKEYSFSQWSYACHAFTYHDQWSLLMVDNTPGGLDYVEKVRRCGVPCAHIEPYQDPVDTISSAWLVLIETAHRDGYEFFLSIEADVICPPETIEVMTDSIGSYEVAIHPVPIRYSNTGFHLALGCTLVSVEAVYERRFVWQRNIENEIINEYHAVRLKQMLAIDHLAYH